MTTCASIRPAPLQCPDRWQIVDQLLALLPRGRAWQSHEAGSMLPQEAAFDDLGFDHRAFVTTDVPGSVLGRYWLAFADVLAFVNSRLCDLRREFFCATHVETHDLWMAEYGLPDACDPYPDLCAKVAAQGGTRCEYFTEVAARAGWAITCTETGPAELTITVDGDASPSYVGGNNRRPMAGCLRAGQSLSCAANLTGVRCLLDRVLPAQIDVTYELAA